MFAVRVHGRAGQGVATTAELLSVAAFHRGLHALALPVYRWQRAGERVVAHCRIDVAPIGSRGPVTRPDAVVVEDWHALADDSARAVGPEGYLLVNSRAGLGEMGLAEKVRDLRSDRVLVVPATELAVVRMGRPLPGAALLGALAALTGVVDLDQVLSALRERFDRLTAEANVVAARAGHSFAAAEREAMSGA